MPPALLWYALRVGEGELRLVMLSAMGLGALLYLLALSPLNPDERNVLVSHQFFLPDGGDAENIERAENEVKQVGNLDAIPAPLIADFGAHPQADEGRQ